MFGPSVINEVLVGFSNTTVTAETYDWAGVGDGNALVRDRGRPADRRHEPARLGQRPHGPRRDRDRLGHARQDLPDQREAHLAQGPPRASSSAGSSCATTSGASTPATTACSASSPTTAPSRASRSPTSCSTRSRARAAAAATRTTPGRTCRTASALFVQDDFKVTPNLTLNLGLRWAYTSPLVEKDNRQSNFDVAPPFGNGTGVQTFANDGDRALYNPYYKGFEPRVGVAWSASDRLVFRGGYGISQFMEGTGANLRLPLNPPFFFESAVSYDRTTGAGTIGTGFADLVPGTTPDRQRARLRPEPAAAVHAAVERVRRVPPHRRHVGPGGLRRTPRDPPGHADRGQPGAAGRGRSRHLGVQDHAPAALRRAAAHHHDRDHDLALRQQVQLDAGEHPPARRGTASSSWPRTRSPRAPPTTAASTASSAARAPRA